MFGLKLNFLEIESLYYKREPLGYYILLHLEIIPSLFFINKNFAGLVSLENGRFVNKCFNDNDFSLFSNLSNLTASSHSYCTRSVSNGLMFKTFYSPIRYGNKSIIISGKYLESFQTIFNGHNLLNMLSKKVKSEQPLRFYCYS